MNETKPISEARQIVGDIAPKLAAQGMTLEYSGEYENQIRAVQTLKVIVPSVCSDTRRPERPRCRYSMTDSLN